MADGHAGARPQHGKGEVRQRQHQPPRGVTHSQAGFVLPQQPLQHHKAGGDVVDAQIPEGKAPSQPALVAPAPGGGDEHKGVDQMGDVDAQRHAHRHAGGAEPPVYAAVRVVAAGAQHQLV